MSESLANKFRPKQFSDVVGQESIIKILQNQIRSGEIKQAYLFCGGAGTGKTTVARIFAREINKERRKVVWQDDTADGRIIEEMLTMEEAEQIANKLEHYDVGNVKQTDWWSNPDEAFDPKREPTQLGQLIEIDAASNNGVDNVREIRETCKYKPINGGYKVYLIDEVHMLSTGAFNALLKTLEEPPAHCVFILCTTDPQKIPATILSRVQRFQFKRMQSEQIVERLLHICVSEQCGIDVAAIEYIAKLANGGMRDAISILDTCNSYRTDDTPLDMSDIVEILGTSSYATYVDLIDGLLDHDQEYVIRTIESVHNDGKDLKQFLKGFMEFILDIEKFNVAGMEFTSIPSTYEEVLERLTRCDLFEKWFERLVKLNEWIKYDPNPKVMIEGCFLALCAR